MTSKAAPSLEVPSGIPPELLFDFDMFYDPRISRDVHAGHMALLAEAPPIFWTPRNGGHWVATRYADVTKILKTPSVFSSVDAPVERTQPLLELPIPPVDLDPPDHRKHRLLLLDFLSTKATRGLEADIRQLVIELVDELQNLRSCEFRSAVAVPLPAKLFVRMMQLDSGRYREFANWVDTITLGGDRARIAPALAGLKNYVDQIISERTARPADDPVSHLLSCTIDGLPLSRQRVHEMCSFLFLAGLDTVTKGMTFIMNWLARNPEAQQALRADPGRIPAAVEELLRRFSFLNLARRVTEDTDMAGVRLRAGEIIIVSLAGASNDDRFVACPGNVDFDRGPTAHVAFGMGPHACPGAPLARTELRIFLEEWLARMPDVRLAPGFVPQGRGGMVMGMKELPLVW